MKKYIKADDMLPREMTQLCSKFQNLVLHSSTAQTWGRHRTAINAYTEFCTVYNTKVAWPASTEQIRAFSTWAVTYKKLQVSTVKTYILSISTIQHLGNVKHENYTDDRSLKLALKGADTLQKANNTPRPVKLAMSIDMLKVLGHRVSMLDWSTHSKQTFWTACTVSFYTSCRMGELLCENEWVYCKDTVRTWRNVKQTDDNEWIVYVPYVKTKGFEGKILDIFLIEKNSTCPATALSELWKISEVSKAKLDSPVFKFQSGKGLTLKKFNVLLKSLLSDFEDDFHKISGHSFRSGIPTALANYPQKSKIADILEWGGGKGKKASRTM